MKGKFKYQESRGLPGGPNEMFTYVTGVFSTEGYKRNSPDVNNPYNVIPSGNITMKGVDFPVVGTDNLGNTKMMMPGKDYKFPGDMVFEIPVAQNGIEVKGRKGVRQNPDGTVSTHLMAREYVPDRGWVAFPTLFQNEDGTWMEIPMDKGWGPAYEEAVKRGEVYDFGEDEKAAIKFADEGSWKQPKYQSKGEVPLTRKEIFNMPRTMAYEDSKMVVQDKPIWDGFLDEVTVTPYTSSEIAFQENRANQATGGLDPIYPVFEALTMGLKTPVTAGAKALQTGVRKAPSVINPRYFKPAEDLWYRQVGKSAIDDIAESRVIRERGEDILNSQRVYNDRILRMKGIDPDTGKPFANWETAQGQKLLGSRRPKSPYFQKGDLYWGWNRKPGKGKPGRGGDADSEYLIESLLGDDAFHPAHVKGLFPDTPDKWVGDIGILKPKPEFRDPENFNLYKRNWWHGYKPIKQEGGEETSWTDYLNPKNWGVTNRDEAGDFKQAFRAARVDGDDQFMWHGERYNTELAPTPEKPEEEKLFYNPSVLEGLSEEQAARRQALLNAANVVAGAQGNDENLRRLLVMSAAMENTLGADPNAYGRDYTRGPMSIDDIAYQDLFAIREGARGYTTQQKKNAAWLNELGIDANNIEQVLRSDDPLAGMAAARLVYGRAPEALPSGDDPDALYNYYLKYYNKGGIDKYGGAEAHRKKFNDFYNQLYRQEGGEQNQFQIYKDYVYGVYDGTEMQKPAEKIYDKLNRVYYKEAKQSGTTIPNYILSKVMNQRG